MYTLTKNIELKNDLILTNQLISNSTKKYTSTENDNLSIIESGPNRIAFNIILLAIKKAKKVICIQSFLIQDSKIIDELINKVKSENLKVYILSSANTRLEKIDTIDDFIISDYKKLLETKFKNNFIFRSSPYFHAKYILIDPETNNSKGYLCTNNFTEKGFSKNVELTILLSTEQCNELFKIFVTHFWEHTTHEQNETETFQFVNPINHFILPKLNHLLITSPHKDYSTLEKTLINEINEAKKSISISTYNFEITQEIIQLLIKKSNENIETIIFVHPKYAKLEDYKKLTDSNIKILLHENFHAKSLILDSKIAFLFTGNIDKLSMKENLEIGLQLNENQANDLITIHNHWKQNLTYTYKNKISIQDLDQTIELKKEGIIEQKVKVSEVIEKTIQPKTVFELIKFFDIKSSNFNNKTKMFSVKLSAKITILENKEINFKDENFCILEENKSKMVVINNHFTFYDLSKIEKYKNYLLVYPKEVNSNNMAV